jgi:hypothetical protein
MGQRYLALASALGLFCTAQLSARGVRAEDASAAETAAARALAVDGLKLAQTGNCAEAVPKLERAEKLYHSAVVASRLGECYVSVGRLVEGTEILRKVLREPQPADPTPALTKALERAQKALDAAKPRIAGLTIKVAAVSELTVKVDGNAVAGALLDMEIPSDPGEHTVEASAPGFLKAATRISVSEGERKTVTLTLSRDPNAPVGGAAPPPAPSGAANPTPSEGRPAASNLPSSESEPPRSPNRTAAYVSLGVGVAGVGAGSVLGIMTMKQRKDLTSSCPDDVCSENQRADIDSAKRLGTLSTVAFGVGAAGLVLGSVLYFTAGPSSSDRAHGPKKPSFAGLSNPRAASPGYRTLGRRSVRHGSSSALISDCSVGVASS